jgi:hypothetical protein
MRGWDLLDAWWAKMECEGRMEWLVRSFEMGFVIKSEDE